MDATELQLRRAIASIENRLDRIEEALCQAGVVTPEDEEEEGEERG